MNGRLRAICGPGTLACLVLTACGSPIRTFPPAQTQADPVICMSRAECDSMWSRAQSFVAQKSAYRMPVVSDYLIETYGPRESAPDLGYRVTRVIAPDGTGEVRLVTTCVYYTGCVPGTTLIGNQFRAYLIQPPAR